MPSLKFVLTQVSLGAALMAAPIPVSGAAGAASAPHRVVALSALGDLAPYKTIATDTLKIVGSGDLMAARTRIKDLELKWDAAEASLKSKDTKVWTLIDKAIDEALAALRTPDPKASECSAALRSLINQMDAVATA